MQRSETLKLVALLAAAWRDAAISDETAGVYSSMLADLDFDVAQQAVHRLINTSKWLPTVAEIRATAADIEHGPVRAGGEAYGDVLAEIRRTGHYGVPRFQDPLVAEAVGIMGWRGLCLGDNEAADRARFIEVYDRLASRGRADVVAGRALPAPRKGLALPVYAPRTLPEPKRATSVTRAELDALLARPVAHTGRRLTAEQIDAELAADGGGK
jgi:hypothetical protein